MYDTDPKERLLSGIVDSDDDEIGVNQLVQRI